MNEYTRALNLFNDMHKRVHMLRLYTHAYIVICTTTQSKGGAPYSKSARAIATAVPVLPTPTPLKFIIIIGRTRAFSLMLLR